ncbi:heme biosynthesis protein HemY [Amylibacter marinus]|uniref:Heme biosynthesis protein HemY n=1 Tax=Amylibacter marinus TaxID=1475483 RepID=A0ABQ5VWF4_9RHOB|nr:heme biosynthesis HemY N-terminal domain-containing protein [Amylibacter marinus]GLQ35632.1 heme biosynthesis protein HemY [Amylibacter marinus]
MLWTITKFFLFVAIIATITYAAGLVMDTGGSVVVEFGGYELAITPIQALIGVLVLVLALWLLQYALGICMAVFHFFNGDETSISRYFNRNREERGYQALTEGLVALAAGEGKQAIDKAAQAERYLDRPNLTNLMNATAAEASGDTKRATKYYKRLLTEDQTRFVGVQGLMKQKLAEGETDVALRLAEKAFSLRPSHNDTQTALFELQTKGGAWDGAQKTLEASVRAGHLPRDVARRRDAILLLEQSRALLDAGDIDAGKQAAIEANKSAPALVPAAVLAAEMHMLDDNKRAASAVIKKSWGLNPHPDLAGAFADIAPDETSTQRLKRFGVLTRQNSDNPETKLLTAELALADEDFPAARRAARELAETTPTTRSLSIMAAIEKGEGADDKTVRAWLNKALNAPRGSQWICDSCSNIHSTWQSRCQNCDSFDTLTWRAVPDMPQPNSAETLGFTAGVITSDASEEQGVKEGEIIDAKPAD